MAGAAPRAAPSARRSAAAASSRRRSPRPGSPEWHVPRPMAAPGPPGGAPGRRQRPAARRGAGQAGRRRRSLSAARLRAGRSSPRPPGSGTASPGQPPAPRGFKHRQTERAGEHGEMSHRRVQAESTGPGQSTARAGCPHPRDTELKPMSSRPPRRQAAVKGRCTPPPSPRKPSLKTKLTPIIWFFSHSNSSYQTKRSKLDKAENTCGSSMTGLSENWHAYQKVSWNRIRETKVWAHSSVKVAILKSQHLEQQNILKTKSS